MNKNIDPLNLKIAYIGGGSRMWARTLMADLTLEPALKGSIHLYDIDFSAAKMNEMLGNWIGTHPEARSSWQYTAVETLPQASVAVHVRVILYSAGHLPAVVSSV